VCQLVLLLLDYSDPVTALRRLGILPKAPVFFNSFNDFSTLCPVIKLATLN
jgi:hypothetical protein